MKYLAAFFSFYIVWFIVAFIVSVIVAVLFSADGPIAAGIVFSADWRTWPGMFLGFTTGIYAAKCIYVRLAPTPGTPMTTLKAAALLLLAYAIVFALDSIISGQQPGRFIYWNRVLTYVPLSLLLSWGLSQASRWAWLSSILFTTVFGAMGLFLVISEMYLRSRTGLTSNPWTISDWFAIGLMTTLLISTFILLLLSSSRQALQRAVQTPPTALQHLEKFVED